MKQYLADLHIHTCLSPCGSLDMSPAVIVRTALDRGLSAIAVTDHNSTLQCPEIQFLGEESGLKVFAGVEVTTREEAHCLVLFETDAARQTFQDYLDAHLPAIPNDPERFGDQVWVNRKEEILGEVPHLLISAIDQSVDQIAAFAKRLGCLFVPAHVERPMFSLIGQLGFIDPSLPVDAIEYNDKGRHEALLQQHAYLTNYTQYTASDAHHPEQIATNPSVWTTEGLSFKQLQMAFEQVDGYSIRPSFQKTDDLSS
ncbi:PHP domain-containing protein [Parabacteroides sp. OttesenSCG-928-G07]|nr:PHP domain-containing protein [Parabacteroides sp. OttesenSCG-928-G21]MDL2278151.1 PHP domain-containing protein [Parabacteroides sp. OttesenSCG-928-G07]